MPESSGQPIAKTALLTITDHGSASPKAVDRKSTSPTPSNDSSSSNDESSRPPTKEEALKLLEEKMKDDCRLRDCAREQLSGLVDLYKAFFLIKAAGDTFDDSSSDIDQGSADQVHHHLSEAAWYIEVSMKYAAREFLGSQDSEFCSMKWTLRQLTSVLPLQWTMR
jgi:hypothetical protein